jgi:hypothetical protein
MDRLAFGTDDGQIYTIPALKLITSLFLSNDQQKEDFGIEFIVFFLKRKKLNFFRCSNTYWS